MDIGGQRHAPAALPPEMTQYPLYKRLGGPQGQSERLRNISHSPGFDSRTVEPVSQSLYRPHYPVPQIPNRDLQKCQFQVLNRESQMITLTH